MIHVPLFIATFFQGRLFNWKREFMFDFHYSSRQLVLTKLKVLVILFLVSTCKSLRFRNKKEPNLRDSLSYLIPYYSVNIHVNFLLGTGWQQLGLDSILGY